jgi:hypothetical protein
MGTDANSKHINDYSGTRITGPSIFKIKPLADGELKTRLEQLAKKPAQNSRSLHSISAVKERLPTLP